MSSNKTEISIDAMVAWSSPLDVVPDEITFDVPYGPPVISKAGAVIINHPPQSDK
jgi:hypothetical protein